MSTKLTVEEIANSDPEILGGEPVFRGTRIPVVMIADMRAAGDSIERIREGYPTLTAEQIALAPEWVKRYGRPLSPPAPGWQKHPPIRTTVLKRRPRESRS